MSVGLGFFRIPFGCKNIRSCSVILFSQQLRHFCKMSEKMAEPKTFLYFAYGSNLWSKRIKENNREARMVSVAKLKEHKLEFGYWTERWQGAAANILPDADSHVYGVLWELDLADQPSLDKQEGVSDNVYQRKELTVETHPEGKVVKCFAYRLRDETRQNSVDTYGDKLLPSLRYKNVIIQGAKEHGVPDDYVKKLEAIIDNGYNGDVQVNIPLK